MAQLGFNAGDYDPADDFAPLPAGEYVVMITEGAVDYTSKGGQMVKLTYTVMDGEFQGRKLWSNHNIVNNSPKAEEIARKEISRIAHAIGQPKLSDTDQLLNQVVRVTAIVKQDVGYNPKNEIKKWEAHGHATSPQRHPATKPYSSAPQEPEPTAEHSAPPWGNQ